MSRREKIGVAIIGWPIPLLVAAFIINTIHDAQYGTPSHVAVVLLTLISTWCAALATGGLRAARRQRRIEQIAQQMPEVIMASRNDDGTVTCTVTRHNGDITTILAPGDYNPRQDDGRWIFEQLLDEKAIREFEEAGATAFMFDREEVDE